MKKLLLLFAPVTMLLFQYLNPKNEVVIHVTAKNAGQEFVTLNYEPRMRGSLSYEGYQTIGAPINSKGEFTLKSDKITDGAEYYLDFNKHIIRLVLFKDDNIKLDADVDNLPASVFATGRGAGKINLMHLVQFQEKFFPVEGTLEGFAAKNDSIMKLRLDILESIYAKNTSANIITQSPEKFKMLRIIKETPLTEKEYLFLKTMAGLQHYYVADYIARMFNSKGMENKAIDFTNPVFKAFSKETYKNIHNLNHHRLANALDLILNVEYIKTKVAEKPQHYKDWDILLTDPAYYDWVSGYLKKEFSPEVHDRYFADIFSMYISMGSINEALHTYLTENCGNKHYLQRINAFKGLIDKGPAAAMRVLNAESFSSLLHNEGGRNVLLVFWSAQYAGASVVHKIPALSYLQDKYGLEVLNICVDSNQYKNLWAARVADTNWKGRHYFLSTEDNPTTLKRFGDTNISAFCNGGAVYAIIDKQGNLHSNLESPTHLTGQVVNNIIK